jgi:hypothetical protein
MLPPGPTLRQTEGESCCLTCWVAEFDTFFFVAADISLTIVAVLVTSFRLCIRVRQKRLGLDDAWVILAMICDLLLLIADCLYLQDFCERLSSMYDAYVLLLKKRSEVLSKYKNSIVLHVRSLFLYLRVVTNATSGLPNSFTELYGKTLVLMF